MNTAIKSIWSNKGKITLCVLALCCVLALIYYMYTRSDLFTPSDTIQIITLVVLVIVTGWYAESTHKIYAVTHKSLEVTHKNLGIAHKSLEVMHKNLEVAHKSYEVALNAEYNAASPIIKLTVEVINVDKIEISYLAKDQHELRTSGRSEKVLNIWRATRIDQFPCNYRSCPKVHPWLLPGH